MFSLPTYIKVHNINVFSSEVFLVLVMRNAFDKLSKKKKKRIQYDYSFVNMGGEGVQDWNDLYFYTF